MTMIRILKYIVLTFAIAGIYTCKNPVSGVEADLEAAKAKWGASGYSTYQMQYSRVCYCSPEHLGAMLDVDAGSVVAFRDVVGYPSEVDIDFMVAAGQLALSSLKSVEGLFEVIAEAIDEKAAKIDVSYDADLGYPSTVDIDYVAETADDEMRYTVSNVVEIQ